MVLSPPHSPLTFLTFLLPIVVTSLSHPSHQLLASYTLPSEMRSILLLLAFVLALAGQTVADPHRHRLSKLHPASSNRVELYNRQSVPTGWTRLSPADSSSPLTFTIAVKGQNADVLERRFWAVSDPDNEQYGEFMTAAEIEQLVAPSDADRFNLYSTLAAHGIAADKVVSHGDSFVVSCTVGQAASLFDTVFYHFQHRTGLKTIRQYGSYSLPAVVAEQVVMVFDIHTFPTIEQRLRMSEQRRVKQAAIRGQSQDDEETTVCWVPQAIARIYELPFPIKPLSSRQVTAGVIEWSEQTFSQSDLMNFSTGVAVPLAPVDEHHIIGNNSEAPYPGIEAELDIQSEQLTTCNTQHVDCLVEQPVLRSSLTYSLFCLPLASALCLCVQVD